MGEANEKRFYIEARSIYDPTPPRFTVSPEVFQKIMAGQEVADSGVASPSLLLMSRFFKVPFAG